MNKPRIILNICLSIFFISSCSEQDETSPTEPINSPPQEFDLINFENDNKEVSLTPNFSWNPSTDLDGDTVTYSLFLDKNESPTTTIAEEISSNNYSLDFNLDRCTRYYWKVRAGDKNSTTDSEIFSFETRSLNFVDPTANLDGQFPLRYRHSSAVYQNMMWIFGGSSGGGPFYSDVWSSSDGLNWEAVNQNAAFGNRNLHTTIAFNDKLWIIGGRNLGDLNDVWNSTDGLNWENLTQDNPFSSRNGHSSVVFKNKMWIIGGISNSNWMSDVLSSDDGQNWELVIENAAFQGRQNHTSVIYKNKIWVIGGRNGLDRFNDVWSSEDGETWTEINENAPFSKRSFHSCFTLDDKLWVLGGSTVDGWKNDVWYTTDGINWTEIDNSFEFPENSHQSVIFENKLYILGGLSSSSGVTSQILGFE